MAIHCHITPGLPVGTPSLALGVLQPVAVKRQPRRKTITSLPFVRNTTKAEREAGMPKRLFWCVNPTGDVVKDQQTGERYARLALRYMQENNMRCLLGWIAGDIHWSKHGLSGIEVGFFATFATAAMKNA